MKQSRLKIRHLLAVMLMSAFSTVAQAQTVVLTTSRNVGENLTFTVNSGTVTINWGDGNVETVRSTGVPIEGILKGSNITISGDNFTRLECEDGNLTEINLSNARQLTSLICNNNELTTLTIPTSSSLTTLDCSSNSLSSLSLSNGRNLIYLNCADNSISALLVSSCANLETFICSNNTISTLTLTSNPALKTLWCQNNLLTRLTITSNPNLVSVLADGNAISSLRTTSMVGLIDFWCDNNEIADLDVSASTKLKTLSFENNEITSLSLPVKTGVQGFYSGGNSLSFSKLYSTKSTQDYEYGTVGHFVLPESEINVNQTFDLSSERNDASGQALTTSYEWERPDGTLLVQGSGQDYRVGSGRMQFYKAFPEIYCLMTSDFFPGLTVRSTALRVNDPNSIENVTQRNGFTYSVVGNTLQMSAEKQIEVDIHTTDGKRVWSGQVGASGVSVQLRSGLYLVNGIKVLL